MTSIHVECSDCGKAYDVPESTAGKRFKCLGCGGYLHVAVSQPEAPAPAPERAAAPARRPGERTARTGNAGRALPRTRAAAVKPDAKSKLPLVAGIGALVLILAGGGYFTFLRKGEVKPSEAGHAAAGRDASGKGATVKSAEPVKANPEAPKDPIAEKKKTLDVKLAEAEKAAAPADALLALVAFCQEEPKLEDSVKGIYERVLAKDSENAVAREALGYRKYEGEDPAHKGQWVTVSVHAELTEADAKKREAEEKRRNEPFVKDSTRIVKEMKSRSAAANGEGKSIGAGAPENPKESELLDVNKARRSDADEVKFQFFFDCKEVPRPYVLAVQDVGNPNPGSWAAEIGEVLSSLHQTFYRRYSNVAKLRDLSNTPVPVWVFASKASYDRWRRCGNLDLPVTTSMRAFYTGTQHLNKSGYLYLWIRDPRDRTALDKDSLEAIRPVAWHEGTHQLMDFNAWSIGSIEGKSPWFQEGFAEYVGAHGSTLDKSVPGGVRYFFGLPNVMRWRGLYESLVPGGEAGDGGSVKTIAMKPSLREIVHCEPFEFTARREFQESVAVDENALEARRFVIATYAAGWALCHFLNHAEDGKYRDKFHDWLRAELEKRSSGQYFDSLFGLDSDEKWNAFELEFRNYVVQALRKDSKDYKDRNDTVNVKYRTDFERACEEGARKAAEGTAAQPESKK